MSSVKLYFIRFILFFIPETRLFGFKRILYRFAGVKIGKNVRICSSTKIMGNGILIIGDNVWIGQDCLLVCSGKSSIIIEDDARLAMRVLIVTGFHQITPESDCILGPGTESNIKISKGSTVLSNSTILPNVTIGSMSMVAAGSVVTKEVAAFTLVAGVPAKVIKRFK